jgi:CheY-like chemotaxis protein
MQNYQKIFNKASIYEKNNSLVEIPVASLLNTNEIAALFNEIIEDFNFECPKANILVVDDNTVNLQVAEGLLSKFKVKIHTATSGKESLNLIFSDNSPKYDIIFMDHMMPEMDGVETLEKIREKEKNENIAKHIVIALSANAMAGAKEMFIEKGFDDFLAKPVQGKDFAHILGKWLPKDLREEKKVEVLTDFLEENIENENTTFEININFSEDFTKEDYYEALNNFESYQTYSKIVRTFYNSIKKNAEQIEDFYKKSEIKSYEILVHALKSSARIIGAKKLSVKAEKLEKAAKENNIVFINENTEDLLTNYNKLIEILSPFIEEREKNNTEEKPELSRDDFFQIIKDIQTALESCDLPTIEEKAEFLKNHQITDSIFSKDAAEKLYQGIEEIDFEKIGEIINSIE